jgi:hypothetical protein
MTKPHSRCEKDLDFMDTRLLYTFDSFCKAQIPRAFLRRQIIRLRPRARFEEQPLLMMFVKPEQSCATRANYV